MSRTNKLFFAVSRGAVSTEAREFKKYIGVAPVKVLAVNPSKSELEKLYNTTMDNDPQYLGESEVNGKKVPQVRLDFIVKTDVKEASGENLEVLNRVTFFIRNMFRVNRDMSKVQVIDKYGRTAWVTKEQFEKKEIPVYSNGPANLDKDYRGCYWGEEELTNFIRAYLNIPDVMRYVNEKWTLIERPEDAEVRFDHVQNWFKGDFSELKEVISFQPNNKVKVLFGVRTTDDGKQYQAVYTQMFLRNSSTRYGRLEEDLKRRKEAGAYPSTEFEVCDIKEYAPKPTDFSQAPEDDLPMSDPGTPWP